MLAHSMDSPAYQRALELVQQGDGVGAERLLDLARSQASSTCGAHSREHASAVFDLARLMVELDDLERAAQWLEKAWTLQPEGHEAQKERLTYNMNLGEVLLRQGRLDEAQRVLEAGLDARRTFYGTRHAGYAYGLQALADVYLARGALEDALTAADRAVGVFWASRNPEVVSAVAIRAAVASRLARPALEMASQLDDPLFERLITVIIGRNDLEAAEAHLRLLQELDLHTIERWGERDPWRINIASAIVETARTSGANEIRVARLRWLVSTMKRRGDDRGTIDALLGLALALDDHGNVDGAREAYEDALDAAQTYDDPRILARVHRNFGLFSCSKGDEARGLEQLESAVARARALDDPAAIARSQIALGISLQHAGELGRARALLEAALENLDPSEPDTLYARSHLAALFQGGTCGCGEIGEALGDAVRDLVVLDLPDDLVEDITVRLENDGTPSIEVRLMRETTADEAADLQRAIRQAVAALQAKLRRNCC